MEKQNSTLKERFQSELKEKFNEKKFDEDVQAGKMISSDNMNEYKKEKKEKEIDIPQKNKDDDNQMSNGNGLYFKGSFKNGEYVAVGSNGHIIKSKNIDDFHRQLAKVFKLNALKNGKEPTCSLLIGEKTTNKKQLSESFARNFINEGVTIMGDVPKSPEFWIRMKSEYLAVKGHDLKTWDKLTRFVPKESMPPVNDYKIGQQKETISKSKPTTTMTKAVSGRGSR